MLEKIKSYMMPISMGLGIAFSSQLNDLNVALPYLVTVLLFTMLFVSYCNISLSEVRITKLHWILLSIQIIGSFVIYKLLSLYQPVVGEGVMICVLAPTATSAIVVAGMLGGNTVSLTSFSLLSNFSVVLVAPIIFALNGYESNVSFGESFFFIFQKVFLILLFPFLLSILLKKFVPRVHTFIRSKQVISFYLWNFALMIVTAKTVTFIAEQDAGNYKTEILIALLSLVVCVSQFFFGRKIGRKYGDTVAAGQGLGQKNTILAIWMSQTYLSPISSIGPGSYVLWQNIINSYQVWKKRKDNKRE